MNKNNLIKKPKKGWIVLMLLFCGLFANTAMGQGTFTWNGATSSSWTTATNWTKSGTATTSTYPGESSSTDLVVVNTTNAPYPVILTSPNSFTVARVTVGNNFGLASGAILTINIGATLNIVSTTVTSLVLNGGNVVNNGAINVTTSAVGSTGFPVYGIACGAPVVAPTVATEYGISGSGTLNITLSAANLATSAGIVTSGTTSILPTYKIAINGTISLNQSSAATINAVRTTAGATANKLIIAGAGFTVGSVGSPSIGSLINLGAGTSITVDSGTTLTFNSANTYTTSVLTGFSSSATATNFTNNGTINILGASLRSGMGFSTGSSATASVFNISNTGTLNVILSAGTTGNSAFNIGNGGGGTVNAGSAVNFTNSGTATFKNTSTAVGAGNAIYCTAAGEGAPLNITNNGTINLECTTYNYGPKTTINNNSIINTNSEFKSFTAINNNVGGSINFVRTTATNTTRQVVFNGLQATDVSGVIGNVYTDGTNNYTVVVQKFATGTTLVANVLSSATIPVSGILTLSSGTGGTTPLTFASVTVSPLNDALSSTTTNSGTINTGTASDLGIISGVTAASTGVIAPGGSSGKGIANFSNASTLAIASTLKLQISGSATAGVDYDQITNTATGGGFDISGATLDLTGIYTPSSATTIDILTTNATGELLNSFALVTGLASGWAMKYTNGTGGKVQLVYGTTTWTGATSTDWIVATNWTAGVPNSALDVVIAAAANQPIIASNVSIKSLTLNASTTLTVYSAYNLTVTGAVANSGTMTIENNANLIQGGTTNTNTGNVIVKRNSNALLRLDYTMWSSPVYSLTQTLADFSPLTSQSPNRFFTYDPVSNLYVNVAPTSTFATGTGYLIRMPNDASTVTSTAYPGVFTGVPNNGDISVTTVPTKYNGVGNPYPSVIDAELFKVSNTDINTLYFWRKTNNLNQGTTQTTSYATYNIATATGTGVTPDGAATGQPTVAPDKFIQVGQGFLFTTAQSSVVFNNGMRVANNGNKILKTKQLEKSRIWLNLSNSSWPINQMALCYADGATQGLDEADSKYFNDSQTALTSLINNEEFVIQGRPAFDAGDVVPLAFKTTATGDYTIALDHFDGVFASGQDVYLLDSKTGTETDLKAGAYTFTAVAGTDNSRFSLKYQKTLKVDAPAFNENSVRVYKNNGALYVNSGAVAMSNIKVFDLQGRLIAEQKSVKANTAVFNNLKATHQVLIVKIAGEDNNVVTKKVVN